MTSPDHERRASPVVPAGSQPDGDLAEPDRLRISVAGTRGHVTLAAVAGTVAIWQLSATGTPTGAWTGDTGDGQFARTALTLVERRAVAGLTPESDLAILEALARVAEAEVPKVYADHYVDVGAALREVAEVRVALAVAAAEHAGKGKLQPLAYVYDLPQRGPPDQLTAALQMLAMRLPASDDRGPAASEALAKSMLLGAATRRWEDTESARLRRAYLRGHGGPTARPLPSGWLAHLEEVYRVPFDL
jgi:hypothetical protein